MKSDKEQQLWRFVEIQPPLFHWLFAFIRLPNNMDEMLYEADELMYRVKNSTKDGFQQAVFE